MNLIGLPTERTGDSSFGAQRPNNIAKNKRNDKASVIKPKTNGCFAVFL